MIPMESLIRDGVAVPAIAMLLKRPLEHVQREYYRMAREACRAELDVPGAPEDRDECVELSLTISLVEPPPGWFRNRTAVWGRPRGRAPLHVAAMQARFAAADAISGADAEEAISDWNCEPFAFEVHYLVEHAVLPPVVPIHGSPRNLPPGAWEIHEPFGDGSAPQPGAITFDAPSDVLTEGPPLVDLPPMAMFIRML